MIEIADLMLFYVDSSLLNIFQLDLPGKSSSCIEAPKLMQIGRSSAFLYPYNIIRRTISTSFSELDPIVSIIIYSIKDIKFISRIVKMTTTV